MYELPLCKHIDEQAKEEIYHFLSQFVNLECLCDYQKDLIVRYLTIRGKDLYVYYNRRNGEIL